MTTLPPARDVLVVGDINLDVLVRPVRPIEYGTDVPAQITTRPGGAGANVAVGLARLGRSVTLAGCVGANDAGVVTDPLAAAGVRLAVRPVPSRRTGAIVAIVDPAGQRSFASDRGANLDLTPADLSEELIREHRHLHVSGYTLFEPGPRSAAKQAIGTALELGRTVSVDPASVGPLREYGIAAFIADTNGVSLLLPNSQEARALAGVEDPATSRQDESDRAADPIDPQAARAARMLVQSYPMVAVSCGATGAMWADQHAVLRRPSIPPPGPVLDTTGAGDAFTAGVLSTWLAGGDPSSCLDGGLRAAAAIVSQFGAQ